MAKVSAIDVDNKVYWLKETRPDWNWTWVDSQSQASDLPLELAENYIKRIRAMQPHLEPADRVVVHLHKGF